ncbi:succinyldiaminopimelate transaminase [Kocuria marina subsp. indica]|uniref:succinyldiaminopimelate transaminase n=1 Tax=Kocuria TaxID=57493 RepID=UPI00103B33D1|nr:MULTISPECIES: succinyldiaminopimelate transaminase [Kocuria]MDT0120885.1 succinyldiaminopimelate transaminase [Kocuria sp. PD6]QBJ21125.1 succinyldiaminopimelate transaminase [Kocuria indica]
MSVARGFGLNLPDYPWNSLAPYRRTAQEHPDGVVDLSIGTPVDPTPLVIQDALAAAADAPGYPTTHGTPALREAVAAWFADRRGVPDLDPDAVMPTVGSKELVAWLPLLLGLGPGDVVVRPVVAYPTYDIGAQIAGAEAVAADSLDELEPSVRERVRMVWVNSPGNPTGIVRDAQSLKRLVDQARSQGAVVVSDECYAELGWGQWDPARGGEPVPSVLDPRVSGGDTSLLFSAYSLSKQSNLAGYRAAFLTGDPALMPSLINSRKHAGMIVPYPVQEAMRVALGDTAHVTAQKNLYRQRREALKPAVEAFGLTIEHSEAGLYLWATAGEDTWDTVERFARLGIVVGPGTFYGDAGHGYVRLSLTASDEHMAAAVQRLSGAV